MKIRFIPRIIVRVSLLIVSVAAIAQPVVHAATPLAITNSSLVFSNPNDVSFQVTGDGTINWTVKNDDSQSVDSGSVSGGGSSAVTIKPKSLTNGFYTLSLTATSGALNAQFMLVGAAPSNNPYYGAATHRVDPQGTIPIMSAIGLNSSRADASWASFETSPGVVTTPNQITNYITKADQTKTQTIWIADYGNPLYEGGQQPVSTPSGQAAYANYINQFLNQNPTVKHIEVYNEFNNTTFNNSSCRTGTCYETLLKAVYTTVKPAHPDVTIIGGGYGGYDADWFKDLFDAGGMQYADAFSYHPYSKSANNLSKTIASLNQLMQTYNNGQIKPIYFTEIGWSVASSDTGTGLRIDTERNQADHLVADYVAPQAYSNMAGVSWYDLVNDGTDPSDTHDNFGLLIPPTSTVSAYQPKQAAYAFYFMRSQLDGFSFDHTTQPASNVNDYFFKNSAGQMKQVILRTDIDSPGNTPAALTSATIPLSAGDQAYVYTSMGQPVSGVLGASTASLSLGTSPLFLSETAAPGAATSQSSGAGTLPTVPKSPNSGFAKAKSYALWAGVSMLMAGLVVIVTIKMHVLRRIRSIIHR